MSKLKEYSLAQFNTEFPDDDICLEFLFRQWYDRVPCCPGCGVIKGQFHRIRKRRCYACADCRYQVYPTAGTIMHRSTTSLKTWFTAIYLFSVSKNNVSALELQRHLGVTYKCAWRIGHSIRVGMSREETDPLRGIVEADEAYIGGRRRSSNRFSNKTPLLGVVERGGRVRIEVASGANASTAIPFLRANVAVGSILHTDESRIYNRAFKTFHHYTVAHSKYEFVRGEDYTNTIEGVWGLLKPSWNGTHRSVSKKYMQFYANEFVWRYNRRNEPQLFPLLLVAAAQPL